MKPIFNLRFTGTDIIMCIRVLLFLFLCSVSQVSCLCGANIQWSHNVNMEDVFGMWYGVLYAQHTPDMTNRPQSVGCVTLYISDLSTGVEDDALNLAAYRRNYSDHSWRSYKSNPWSNTDLSGSWLDIRVKRRSKRNMYQDRRVRVVWDEDGQTMEQIYTYSPEGPGLWTAENYRPLEREMVSRGIDVWYPDDPPRHPDVIRILKVTPEVLIINHCSETGGGGIFSLILQRSPAIVDRWQWYEYQRQFYNFDLPSVQRHTAVCAACGIFTSFVNLVVCVAVLLLVQS